MSYLLIIEREMVTQDGGRTQKEEKTMAKTNWEDITEESSKRGGGGRVRSVTGVRRAKTGAAYALFPEGEFDAPYAKILYNAEANAIAFEPTEERTNAKVKPQYENKTKGTRSNVMMIHIPKRFADKVPAGTTDVVMKKQNNRFILKLDDLTEKHEEAGA